MSPPQRIGRRRMESIYFVLTWLCHRRCRHCYDDRFRPYVRDELQQVVEQSQTNVPRIIDHLPESMMVTDPAGAKVKGRIIVSGGEVLLEPVRKSVLYPALEQIGSRYRGEVHLVVQTTGDRLTARILDELLARNVSTISVSGFDSYHVGINRADRARALREQLLAMFEAAGVREAGNGLPGDDSPPLFNIFGANEDTWIGKLWPRGRAWKNGLSRAGMEDNFCNAWSGGLNFLEKGRTGSEVSIEPTGDVYPCCLKTRLPIGNLVHEHLDDIIDSLRDHPVYEAINRGKPETMGHAFGWSTERFLAESQIDTPQGRSYQNLCIGCDRFHDKVLGPMIESARQERLGQA